MRKNKNIYMGENSTAKMPVFGRVDTDNEICLNAIATAYDALNNKMLTRQHGMFDKTTLTEINGRFGVLRMLCRKYAPSKLIVIDKIHKVVVDNFRGHISDSKAVSSLQNICTQHNLNPGILNIAAIQINQAEQMKMQMPTPFGIDMFQLLGQQNMNQKKKRRMR